MSKPKDEWDKPEKSSDKTRGAFKRSSIYRQEWKAAFQSYLQSLPPDRKTLPLNELRDDFVESSAVKSGNALADQYHPGKILCQRWGLAFALPPDDAAWDISSENAPALFANYGMAVKIIPYEQSSFHLPAQPWIGIKDRYALLKEGRYLSLEIDLSHSKNHIEAEINKLLIKYQFLIGKEAKRGKSSDIYLETPSGPVDYYQVWDMNKKERKSAWQITKELYPDIASKYPLSWEIDENTGKLTQEDKQALKLLWKVERALEKARKEIDSINPTA